MYLDTMSDILIHSHPLVVDDRLKGLVPFLPLNVPPPSGTRTGAAASAIDTPATPPQVPAANSTSATTR